MPKFPKCNFGLRLFFQLNPAPDIKLLQNQLSREFAGLCGFGYSISARFIAMSVCGRRSMHDLVCLSLTVIAPETHAIEDIG